MAFALRNLSVLAYARGFTLWHYSAGPDAPAEVARPGYFAGAGDMLAGGDMVLVSANEGGRMLCVAREGASVRTVPLG
jgi:hypothetical protein